MKKIGIVGPMSEINFGDYAMFINNVYDLKEIDNIEIVMFSYNKNFSDRIVEEYLKNLEIKITNIEVKLKRDSNKYFEINIEKKIRVGFQEFNFPTITPIDILLNTENYTEILEELKTIDVLLVNGGGYFNHLWNNSIWRSDMLKKIISPILIANQLNKKIYFSGNGYGPFDQSEEFFNYIFNYLRNVKYGVRDRLYSPKYLEKLGIEKEKIKFIPDDLLLLNKNILKNKIKNFDIKVKDKYILMELYYPLEEIKEYKNIIKEFCKNIYENYGLKVLFVPFDFERGGMWQKDLLKEEIPELLDYDLTKIGFLPIQDLVQMVKNAELVICNRYHALVFSLALKTPVVNIMKKVCDDYRYYFNKNYGLLEYIFSGLIFNELDFLNLDLKETLIKVQKELSDIIKRQKELYNSEEYCLNIKKLANIRKGYLEEILN